MFKKRNKEKKVDLNKDMQEIEVNNNDNEKLDQPIVTIPKSIHSKKIHKIHVNEKIESRPNNPSEAEAKPASRLRYGLIDYQQIGKKQQPEENNALMNLYVKKKLQ